MKKLLFIGLIANSLLATSAFAKDPAAKPEIVKPPCIGTVTADKAHFWVDKPLQMTSSFIVKGDTVTIKNLYSYGETGDFYYVVYSKEWFRLIEKADLVEGAGCDI